MFYVSGITIYEDSCLLPKYLLKYTNQVDEAINIKGKKNVIETEQHSTELNSAESQLIAEVPDDICVDLCDISKFGNFSDGLNIKDFSKSSQYLKIISQNEKHCNAGNLDNIQTEFVSVTIKNKDLVIKKSSLCWLLDNKYKRISNDRLRRFMNNSKQNTILSKKSIQPTQASKHLTIKSITAKNIKKQSDISSEDVDDPSNMQLCDDKVSDYNSDDNIPEEVQYQTPVWTNIKPGTYLLVQFDRNGSVSCRKKTRFSYVCCVLRVDDDDGEIIVQGMKKEKILGANGGTQFCMKENDMSSINLEMVKAILPEPTLFHKSRKLIYEFPGFVSVEEM